VSKPVWALMMLNARDLMNQAETLRDEALSTRCPVTDSAGEQCTADRMPEHDHRISDDDLPI
jgi:hypothetical protein